MAFFDQRRTLHVVHEAIYSRNVMQLNAVKKIVRALVADMIKEGYGTPADLKEMIKASKVETREPSILEIKELLDHAPSSVWEDAGLTKEEMFQRIYESTRITKG